MDYFEKTELNYMAKKSYQWRRSVAFIVGAKKRAKTLYVCNGKRIPEAKSPIALV